MDSSVTTTFLTQRLFFVAMGIIALGISWGIGKALQKDILKKLNHDGYRQLFIPLLASIVKNTFLGLGILAFIAALGIDISSVIQAIAFVGFGIGFILKDLLADLVSGFLILAYKPFDPGHELVLQLDKATYRGKVISIDIRYTTLENDAEKILIPNAFLFKQPLSITK